MTFASVTADHSANLASSKRIVSARIVMRRQDGPIEGDP
jgi:hypothetical protein